MLSRPYPLWILISALALSAPGSLYAQNYSDAARVAERGIAFSGRSMSLGNSFVTYGDDFSASLFNPATLGLVGRTTVSYSVNVNYFNNQADFLNTPSSSWSNNTSLNQFGLAISLRDSSAFILALGYTSTNDYNRILRFDAYNDGAGSLVQDLAGANSIVPLDLGLGYQVYDSVSGAFRQVSIVNGDVRQIGYLLDGGTRTSFSLGTSYEFLTNLFLGGSISYTTGILTSDREYEEHDTQDAYGTDRPTNPSDPQTADWQYMYLHDVREVSTKGVDVRFGVLYKLFNWISIGGAVKVPSVASVSENRVTEGYAQYAAGRKVTERPETYLDYNLRPPMEISAGTAMNLWFIRATAEATYIDYTEMEFTSGFDLADRSLKNKEIKEVFRPVVHLNVGAEFDVPLTGLQLRAGGMYRMSPYSDEVNNVTDEQPRQFDQFYLSAGLGINLSDRVAFDLAYMVGFWEESRRAYPSSLSTITQDVVVHNALVTTRFRL